MEITERQGKILKKIIEEYIHLAKPISSQFLEKKYNLGICPATIRIEMQKLTEKGYLFQPHTSAGRIPTDKGYRFFVNSLLEKEPEEFDEEFNIENWIESIENWIEEEVNQTIKIIQSLTKNLASYSQALVLSYLKNEKIFLKEGWEEILKKPEFRENDYIINFTKFLEDFQKNIERLDIDSEIKIYIGKENPFKGAKDFSIISSKCCLADKKETIFSLLGPKRMDYNRNIGLINSLIKLLND